MMRGLCEAISSAGEAQAGGRGARGRDRSRSRSRSRKRGGSSADKELKQMVNRCERALLREAGVATIEKVPELVRTLKKEAATATQRADVLQTRLDDILGPGIVPSLEQTAKEAVEWRRRAENSERELAGLLRRCDNAPDADALVADYVCMERKVRGLREDLEEIKEEADARRAAERCCEELRVRDVLAQVGLDTWEGVVDRIGELTRVKDEAVGKREEAERACEGMKQTLEELEEIRGHYQVHTEWLQGLMQKAGVEDLEALQALVMGAGRKEDGSEEQSDKVQELVQRVKACSMLLLL
jgi:hypothetical protein